VIVRRCRRVLQAQLQSAAWGVHACVHATAALAACMLGIAAPLAFAAPTVEYALGLEPFQPGVEYDQLSAGEADKATISMEKGAGGSAWVVRAEDGRVLRTFSDTNNDRVVDRWSYFRNGIEVYRDIDSDNNSKADQARWLGEAGTRWGVDDNEDGVLDRWESISAEEVTAEIVAALAEGNARAFSRLLPSRDELETAGFQGERLEALTARTAAAAQGFADLVAGQPPVDRDARWNNMLASLPGVLPADGDTMAKDAVAYDNVVALFEAGGSTGQVFVGSLVKCGNAWRPLDMPQLPGKTGEISEPLAFFSPRMPAAAAAGPQMSDAIKPLLESLRTVEEALMQAGPTQRPQLMARQLAVLQEIAAEAPAEDRDFWIRQLAETIAAAVQESAIEDGIERLQLLGEQVAGDPDLAGFVAFRLASSRYAAGMLAEDADLEAVQTAWLSDLEAFVEAYPASQDAAEAMLQIGIAEEFSGNEEAAVQRYLQIADAFPATAAARKAAGAARRLESVGKPLPLTGTTSDGRPFSLASLKGTPVLVHYWATWCEPCKVDIARIRELRESIGPKRFAVVGISLDADRDTLTSYLGSNGIPWVQLYEEGGLDGRLAEELGVLTLPTMLLLDAEGNVVDRNVMITDLEKKLGEVLSQP
jgi:thiol-disulfide isomerase/thioredoxin